MEFRIVSEPPAPKAPRGSKVWRRRLFGTKKRIVAVIAVLALIASSVALAAWWVTASGTGGTKFGSLQQPTITAIYVGSLGPNQSADVKADIDSPGSYPLVIQGVQANGITTGNQFCNDFFANPANWSFTAQTGTPIPANTTTAGVTLGSLSVGDAPNGCQGQDVSVAVQVDFSTP